MESNSSSGGDSSKLRKKAEEKKVSKDKLLPKDMESELGHELDVHKIELEMQNEELHFTQVKLWKLNEVYAELFDRAPAGYFILNREGVILNVNIKACENFKMDKFSLLKKTFLKFIDSETGQDNYYLHNNLVAETEQTQQLECDMVRNDGSVFSALIETTLVKDGKGDFKYFLSLVSDISLRKDQERKMELALIRETELNEMKSQFIAIASHEFRTPLAAILLSADLIERYTDPKDEEKKIKHFARIKSSVARVKDILSDFLSMSHIERGLKTNNPSLFNLQEFAVEFIDEIRMLNAAHTIKYEPLGEGYDVYLDKQLLRVCLTNLISNAVKYSPIGGTIEFSVSTGMQGNLEIVIKDYGFGIPEIEQVHVFEQFFRAKNVMTIQGLGIGLSITHKIVSLMGGTITFESTENMGTTFILSFPKK
ncbi:MAG: PAS domain-containing sensor histidine kinase [Bacteroidetes bacterium]|nr:PAS domain-containing sensor histidine kinase [Bacteroidota bacterium]